MNTVAEKVWEKLGINYKETVEKTKCLIVKNETDHKQISEKNDFVRITLKNSMDLWFLNQYLNNFKCSIRWLHIESYDIHKKNKLELKRNSNIISNLIGFNKDNI